MRVVVTGRGLVCGLGNLQQTWEQLLAGKSAVKLQQPFPTFPPLPLALVKDQPSSLDPLIRTLVGATLQEAGLTPPLKNCGVVVGSSRHHQSQWEAGAPDWYASLPQTTALQVARQIGSEGPVLSPMAACATGMWAVFQGLELLRSRTCEQVLVGAVEAPITPLTLAGFSRLGVLAPEGSYPFDRQRQGLVLGEGGGMLLLEIATPGRQHHGAILGVGLTNDAYHPSSPDPTGQGAQRALQACLHYSHLRPVDIGHVHCHGTGTRLNDQAEASLIQRHLPQAAISASKGATGHTLGASALLGVLFALLALEDQVMPPCVGLRDPAFELNFVRSPRPAIIEYALGLSFGFGGQNGVLAVARG